MMNNTHEASTQGSRPFSNQVEIPCFDELVELARNNPAQLEALRIELCEQVIASAPRDMRRRLQGLQFKIDMERKKASSPMQACMKLSSLMNESLVKLQLALTNPKDYLNQQYGQKAEVVPIFCPVAD